MQRVAALTGMRGVAALMVVGYHAVLFMWLAQMESGRPADAFTHPWSAWGLGGGWLGVDFFFVLSGFLLAGPLLRQRDHWPTWPEYRLFAAKRLLRIVPPYYAALLLAWLLAGWSGHALFRVTPEGLLWHASFLHVFVPEHQFGIIAVAWTLALELQFYLLLPLIVVPFRRWGPWVAASFVVASLAYVAWAQDPDWARDRFQVYQFPAFLGHFGFGIAAAQLAQRGWRPPGDPDLVAALAFAALVVTPAALTGYTQAFETPDHVVAKHLVRPLAALFFAILVLCALADDSRIGRALTVRPLLVLGEASYSLYLVHWSLGGLLLVTGASAWAFASVPSFTILFTAMSLLLCAAFYALVEWPSLLLKDEVSRRLHAPARPHGLDPAP